MIVIRVGHCFPIWKRFERLRAGSLEKNPVSCIVPIGLLFILTIVLLFSMRRCLLFLHSASSLFSHISTALTWGRWQAGIARDHQGPDSPLLKDSGNTLIRTSSWTKCSRAFMGMIAIFAWPWIHSSLSCQNQERLYSVKNLKTFISMEIINTSPTSLLPSSTVSSYGSLHIMSIKKVSLVCLRYD